MESYASSASLAVGDVVADTKVCNGCDVMCNGCDVVFSLVLCCDVV
jgi:hypothetical protein